MWLSPTTKAPTPTEKSKKQLDNIKNATKTLIRQRLRTNLGRPVGVTAVTPLVLFNKTKWPIILFANDKRYVCRFGMANANF